MSSENYDRKMHDPDEKKRKRFGKRDDHDDGGLDT